MTTETKAAIPFKLMCDAIDTLNGVLEDKAMHLKTIGTKKEVLIEQFVSRINDVIEAKADGQLPESVCAFYNTYLLPVAQGARPFSSKKAKGAKAATESVPTKDAAKPADTKKAGTPAATKPAKVEPKKETPAAPAAAPGKKFPMKKPAATPTGTPPAKGGFKKGTPLTAGGKKTGLKADVPPPKKDGKKTSVKRGSGMVKRLVGLYVIDGITDSKELAVIIDKEFPNTKNRSTIGHVRCILGNIPDGYLKPVKAGK